jgi:hypothetical protein
MSSLKFVKAAVEPLFYEAEFGLMLWFEDSDGFRYRHAIRIPVGEPMLDTLKGLEGFTEWFRVYAEDKKAKVK